MPAGVRVGVWDPARAEPAADNLKDADAVIHLAGEPVAQRWTEESKQRIRESRVAGTRNLVAAIAKLDRRPAVLVCASAVGYYGSRGDEELTESSAPGSGFLADVCRDWEKEAAEAEPLGVRVAAIRTGIVLDPRGGALARILPPFRFGAGGRLGSGRQWMPWIHIDDLVDLFRFAAEKPVHGPLNGAAPNPVVNADFTRALAQALRRPAIFPVPEFVLHAIYGEMADVLFASQRVVPREAEAAGFRFRFPELGAALKDLLT